jgi:hypothetical protein
MPKNDPTLRRVLSIVVFVAAAPAAPVAAADPEPARTADPESSPEAAETEPPAVSFDVEPPTEAVDPQPASAAASARPSSFIDTRLNFTFTHENLLADLDQSQVPNYAGFRFGPPSSLGTLFFDNYDTRFSGFETLSHLVLYKPYQHEAWEVEGALVLRINDLSEQGIALSDAGSYLRAAYWLDPKRARQDRISVTAFPTSSDRFRLGYSYRLSWGGNDEYRREKEPVPGVKVQYDGDRFYAFVGAKTAVLVDKALDEERAAQAVLAGAGVDLSDEIRVEVNGGYFNRGSNQLADVIDEDVQLFGGSVQVAVHDGMPVGSSVDYKLYRNDPERAVRLFKQEEYPGGLAWLVTAEATLIGQTLKDLAAPGSTTIQYGAAGDVNFRIKYDFTRFRLDIQYRDLAFILHPTPSLPAFTDFPEEYDISHNLFAAAGVDHHFAAWGLTAGAVLGLDRPATLTSPKALPGDPVDQPGQSTYVIRGEGDLTPLPVGEEVFPQIAFKLSGRLDFAQHFASVLDVYYSYDPNRSRLTRDDPESLYEFDEDNFHQLGFNLTLQARF